MHKTEISATLINYSAMFWKQHLVTLENDIDEMQASNENMTRQLADVNKESSQLIEQVTSLQSRR
jgi:hypothetical protein